MGVYDKFTYVSIVLKYQKVYITINANFHAQQILKSIALFIVQKAVYVASS